MSVAPSGLFILNTSTTTTAISNTVDPLQKALLSTVQPLHCTGCENCLSVCPSDSLLWSPTAEQVVSIDLDSCTSCGLCITACAESNVTTPQSSATFPSTSLASLQSALGTSSTGTVAAGSGFNTIIGISPTYDFSVSLRTGSWLLTPSDPPSLDFSSITIPLPANGAADGLGVLRDFNNLDDTLEHYRQKYSIHDPIAVLPSQTYGGPPSDDRNQFYDPTEQFLKDQQNASLLVRDNPEYPGHLMFRVEVLEQLRLLYAGVKELADSAYARGKREGHSIIMGLASGDLSLDDFNRRTTEKRRNGQD